MIPSFLRLFRSFELDEGGFRAYTRGKGSFLLALSRAGDKEGEGLLVLDAKSQVSLPI